MGSIAGQGTRFRAFSSDELKRQRVAFINTPPLLRSGLHAPDFNLIRIAHTMEYFDSFKAV